MSRSSPTTTRAVNEKRRPPLTTLATRLISTTRSWRSRPAGLMVLLGAMSLCRVAVAGALNREPAFAGAFGEGLDAAVVAVAAAVEHRALDAGGPGALGQERVDLLGLLHPGERLEVCLRPGRGRDRVAAIVVDQLRADAAVGTKHGDAGALGAAADLCAHATVAPLTLLRLRGDAHARLPT